MVFIKRVKWFTLLAAGVITIGFGSAVAVWQEQGRVEAELATAVVKKLHSLGYSWTGVDVIGRDVTISGLTTSADELEEVAELTAAHNGVRTVELNVDIGFRRAQTSRLA